MYKDSSLLAYYYSWEHVNDAMLPNIMAEFKWHGVNHLVFSYVWLERILREVGFWSFLNTQAKKQQMQLVEAHAPCGQGYDLCCPEYGRRSVMIEEHKRLMNFCAESGCRTYTMHVGAYESVYYQTPNSVLLPLITNSLEQLLPTAEKLGLIIALENSYERSNTPDIVAGLAEHFRSPYLGCCLDVGHAHVMAPFPGKERSKYTEEMTRAWGEHIEEYDGALERMAPHIVTCHLHDNNGYADAHQLPGTGSIDWQALVPKLKSLPNLLSMQTEVRTVSGLPIAKLTDTFRTILNQK